LAAGLASVLWLVAVKMARIRKVRCQGAVGEEWGRSMDPGGLPRPSLLGVSFSGPGFFRTWFFSDLGLKGLGLKGLGLKGLGLKGLGAQGLDLEGLGSETGRNRLQWNRFKSFALPAKENCG